MNRHQKQAYRTIVAQLIVAIVVAFGWGLIAWHSGLSALLGGLVVTAGNGYFAWRLFRKMEQRSAQSILLGMYLNELLKLVICAAAVVVLIFVCHLALLPVMTGVLAAYLVVAPMAIYQQIKMVRR